MLIRTQDRYGIVNLCCIDNIMLGETDRFGTCDIVAYRGGNTTIMGHYEEERAAEILGEICNAFIGLNHVDRNTGAAVVKNGIFIMPEE